MSQGAATTPAKAPVRFVALRYPAFRTFWLATTVSSIGNFMEIPIRGWLVWTLSESPLILGLNQVAHWLPFFLLTLYAGVVADRVERRRLLAVTQAILLGTVLATGLLVFTGWVNIWWIMALTVIHGTVEALGAPVGLALVSDLVRKEHVMNGVALNSVAMQTARFVGPAIGGVLVGYVGVAGALLIDGLTFVPFVLVVLTLPIAPSPYKARAETLWRNLVQSFSYMRQNPALLSLVVVIAIPSIFAMQTSTLMPAFAGDVLHVGPTEYGMLLSASGCGALIAGLTLSYLHDVKRKGPLILITTLLSGLFMLLFGVSGWFGLSLVFLFAAGATQVVYSALTNTVLQVSAAQEMRGRVMGFFAWGNMGMVVVGSLEAGLLAQTLGAPWTMALAGIATMLGVPLALWLAPAVRRVN